MIRFSLFRSALYHQRIPGLYCMPIRQVYQSQKCCGDRRCHDRGTLEGSRCRDHGEHNISEGGLWMETHNLIYGRTKSVELEAHAGWFQWRRICSIAAGASPIDRAVMWGSLRIPAAFCGIWSHKATGGLVPNTGHPPATGRATVFAHWPNGQNRVDIRAMLKVLAGPDHQDSQCRALDRELPSRLDALSSESSPSRPGKVSPRLPTKAVLDAAQALENEATIEEHHFPNLKHSLEIWSIMLQRVLKNPMTLYWGGTPSPVFRELLKAPFGRSVHSYPAAWWGPLKSCSSISKRLAKYVTSTGPSAKLKQYWAMMVFYCTHHTPAPRHHWGFATPFDAVYRDLQCDGVSCNSVPSP